MIETNGKQNCSQEFKLSAYRLAFESKHHYDNLSWVIGGIVLVFLGALLAYIPQIRDSSDVYTVAKRLPYGLFAVMILLLWAAIYKRNRYWAEVANEKIKKFEREYHIEGAGLAFMKANFAEQLLPSNKDENGTIIHEGMPISRPKTAMHTVVYRIQLVIILAILLACFIPLFSRI